MGRCAPGLLGIPGPPLRPAPLLFAALPEEAAPPLPALLLVLLGTFQPLFGQALFILLTTSVGDMPYRSWTKSFTDT